MTMPRTLLVRNADVLVTMDRHGREIAGGGVYVEDNRIVSVGASATLPTTADTVIDASGHVVLPGLVNTHHHMFQSLTRAVPGAQDCALFPWLKRLYPIWAGLTPEMIRVSTQVAMAELILSGCTTSSDHLYLFPGGCRLDDAIAGAREIGMRFHASRGSMSVGESDGGLPPDSAGRGRGRDPAGLAARDRGVPRSAPLLDAARRARALLAVLGQPDADARIGAPRARLRRVAAHASGGERR